MSLTNHPGWQSDILQPSNKVFFPAFSDRTVYTIVKECTGWGRLFWQSGKYKFGFNSHLRLASLYLHWRLACCNYFLACLGSRKASKWKLTIQAAIFSDYPLTGNIFKPLSPSSLSCVTLNMERWCLNLREIYYLLIGYYLIFIHFFPCQISLVILLTFRLHFLISLSILKSQKLLNLCEIVLSKLTKDIITLWLSYPSSKYSPENSFSYLLT